MNKNIETVVTEQEVVGVANHTGLRKGAVIVAVAGLIGIAGYLTHRFVVKPIAKKIKAKKESKKAKEEIPANHQTSFFDDDELDAPIEPLFPDKE